MLNAAPAPGPAEITMDPLQVNDRRWARGAAGSLALLVCGAAQAAGDCAPAAGAPPLCLDGTVTANDYQAALVEEPGSHAVKTVQAGDTLDGWEVSEVGARYVVLTHDGEQARLDLDGGPTETTPAPPPKPARPLIRPHPRAAGKPGGDDAYAK